MSYVLSVLIGLDQFANAILGGNPADTISYRAGVAQSQGKRWGCVLCRLLDCFQKNHCQKTVASLRAEIENDAKAFEHGELPL